MTRAQGFRKMFSMRTLVILATVAIGAVHILWRSWSPPKPIEFATEWTADE